MMELRNSGGTSLGIIRFLKIIRAFLPAVRETEANNRQVSFSLINSQIFDNAKQLILSSGMVSSQPCASSVNIFIRPILALIISKFSFFKKAGTSLSFLYFPCRYKDRK